MANSKHAEYIEYARKKLEETALQYAQCKTMGFYMENEQRVFPCTVDIETYNKMFLGNLGRAAEALLQELSCTPLPKRKV
jgi:hypothetical protein